MSIQTEWFRLFIPC